MRSDTLRTMLVFSLAVASCRSNECELGQTDQRNDDGTFVCVSCPPNCSICSISQLTKEPKCTFCHDGYHVTDEGTCLPCVSNCFHCFGPEIGQCRSIMAGYRYDDESKSIVPCSHPGCSICDATDRCASCHEHFYEVALPTDISSGVMQRYVECRPCDIDKCSICKVVNDQIKNADYLTCTSCDKGYTVVSGHCEKCPDNCEYCEEETQQCQMCLKGYALNPDSHECVQPQISSCLTFLSLNACEYCNSGYYLDHTENTCKSCHTITSRCSFCYTDFDGPRCSSCDRGLYLDKSNKCSPCPPLCNYCFEDQCYGCEHGFYWNDKSKQCLKCDQPNCSYCTSDGQCTVCQEGYILDHASQKCVKFTN